MQESPDRRRHPKCADFGARGQRLARIAPPLQRAVPGFLAADHGDLQLSLESLCETWAALVKGLRQVLCACVLKLLHKSFRSIQTYDIPAKTGLVVPG